ncbi:MAG: hypothetical protein KAU21_11005 [Gammaproteobacteria bacterium]|nr:hypothetical protein [Gammaproteobacteria bacterium]
MQSKVGYQRMGKSVTGFNHLSAVCMYTLAIGKHSSLYDCIITSDITRDDASVMRGMLM